MSDVKTLKKKLVSTLLNALDNPEDEATFKAAMTTSAKVVKDFQHEADDDDRDMQIKNDRLASYLKSRPSPTQVKN